METVMAIILGIGWFLIIVAVFIWLLKVLVQLLSDLKHDVRMAFIANEGDISGFFDDLSDAAITLLLIGLWFIGLWLVGVPLSAVATEFNGC